MRLYYGIICALIGALLLILSYVCGWVDYNWVQFIAVLIIIGGIATHIWVNYRKPVYDEDKKEQEAK